MEKKELRLRFETDNQSTPVEISKVVELDLEATDKEFIHLDKMKGGSFRLTFTKGLLKVKDAEDSGH